jgi:DNA-binding LacI/PurR family transcriptional regulator
LPKVVREVAADGLLINMSAGIQDHLLDALHALKTPAVWINTKQREDAVYPDDVHTGRWATEHLVSQGHRRVVFITQGELEGDVHYSVIDRRRGYDEVMRESGLEPQSMGMPGALHTLEEIRA